MNKPLAVAVIACSLCGCTRNFTPVSQAALIVGDEKDADAAKEIDEFLSSNGYKNKVVSSRPGDHRWYEGNDPVFIDIDLNPEHCISFIAYVESGTTEFVAAKSISQQFLVHFGGKWPIKHDQVCGQATNDSLNQIP